ncbi:MAG: hypothetical protein ACXWWC_02830 [Chitinophagaceae bacterium]
MSFHSTQLSLLKLVHEDLHLGNGIYNLDQVKRYTRKKATARLQLL